MNDIADWRSVHIGFADDGLTIAGVDIWGESWRATGLAPVMLPHPRYPDQRHRHDIHEVGDPAAPVRFAVAELSNGVWGFAVPALADPVPAGAAPTRRAAPDGSIEVDIETTEWRNGQWIDAPRITEAATGRMLLDLWNSDWDVAVSFPRDRCVRLDVQRAHHGGDLAMELDLAADRYRIVREAGRDVPDEDGPLADAAAALEAAACRSAAFHAAAAGRGAYVAPIVTSPWAAWRAGLLIFAGTAILLAGVGWWQWRAEQRGRAERALLRPVPRFTPSPAARPTLPAISPED